MVVLTRRIGEEINIGDGKILLTVTKIRGQQVEIGVVAPKEMAVRRAEFEQGPPQMKVVPK